MKTVIILLGFIVVFIAGALLGSKYLDPKDFSARQVRQGGHALVNPLLECEVGSVQNKEFVGLEARLRGMIEEATQRGDITEGAVYVRDLNNGPWVSVNARSEFSPASLLKLPLMITYFRYDELNPGFLKKKIKYEPTTNLNANMNVKVEKQLETGEEYTYEELVRQMIVQSDNDVMAFLVSNLDISRQDEIYNDLGLSIPGVRGIEDFMSVTDYAGFFRILYNSSYLTIKNSERALQMLTETSYDHGIKGGVPDDVLIAHKFGERKIAQGDQLHDCGIVYYRDRPYLICLMTRGSSFEKLDGVIRSLSAEVYKSVDKATK